MSSVPRPALNDNGVVGLLYNATKDTILTTNIFTENPRDLVKVVESPKMEWNMVDSDSLKAKFSALRMSSDLAASYVSGMTTARTTSQSLLSRPLPGRLVEEAQAVCDIHTTHESLDFEADFFSELVEADVFQNNPEATHVICAAQLGIRTVITATRKSADEKVANGFINGTLPNGTLPNGTGDHIPSTANASQSLLKALQESTSGGASLSVPVDVDSSIELRLISDRKDKGKDNTTIDERARSYSEAVDFLRTVPNTVKEKKVRPVRLTLFLMPVEEFAQKVGQSADIKKVQIEPNALGEVLDMFERLDKIKRDLMDYSTDVKTHGFCIPLDRIKAVESEGAEVAARRVELDMKADFRNALEAARIQGNVSPLTPVLSEYRKVLSSEGPLMAIIGNWSAKMLVADQTKQGDVLYRPGTIDALKSLVTESAPGELYVLHFNASSLSSTVWSDNYALWMELMRNKDSKGLSFGCIDYDMGTLSLESPRIDHYRSGLLFVADVVAERKLLAAKPLVRCVDEGRIEKLLVPDIPEESKRPIKIECPGTTCNSTVSHEWICPKCKDVATFAPDVEKIYCRCGKYKYSDALFRCNDPKHGTSFVPHTTGLLEKLKALKPYSQYNILVLGETGIGKSTVVNMITNLLMFDTFDAALKQDSLYYAIPGAFQWRERVDGKETGKSTEISWGVHSDQEKKSVSGASATQDAVIHEFKLNGKLFRLIDTPGICDTRGLLQDAANIKKILGTLEGVEHLSAIFMLMDPSKARLTTNFDWCLTELLSKLHRDSSKNLIFGFTRARVTNFQVGDVAVPLMELLKLRNTGITKLDETNTFFYDADWFRYLAGIKTIGKEIDEKATCNKSFQLCLAETRRLLNRVQQLPLHAVRDTLALNRVRTVVLDMVKPIVTQSAAITQSTNLLKANEEKLNQLGRDAIDPKLLKMMIWKTKTEKLSRPQTVCTDPLCRQWKTNPTTGQPYDVYSPICHDVCAIDTPDVKLGLPELLQCSAFDSSSGMCYVCKHKWDAHWHVTYVISLEQVEVPNPTNVQKDLDNKNTKEATEKFLANQRQVVKNLEAEQTTMNRALAKFTIFLKEESYVAMNDKTIEYLDIQIAQAEMPGFSHPEYVAIYKMQKEGYELQMAQAKQAIANNTEKKPDRAALDAIFQELRTLPTVGKDLQLLMPPAGSIKRPPILSNLIRLTPTGITFYSWLEEGSQKV